MKSFKEFLGEEVIVESINYSNMSETDIKEFVKFIKSSTSNVVSQVKDGNIGDVVGFVRALISGLTKWEEKLIKSDIR
jgi:hypothetical protein